LWSAPLFVRTPGSSPSGSHCYSQSISPNKTMTRHWWQYIGSHGVWLTVETPKVLFLFAPNSSFQTQSDCQGST
jgi:hypothetical protein